MRSVHGTCTWGTYRHRDGTPYGVELDAGQAREALQGSLDIEARVSNAAGGCLASGLQDTDSPYSPFTRVAEDLGYDGDPTLEPSPFFTTLHGYRTSLDHLIEDEE
ncbi:hypothetical protein AHiyo1_47110 [Arthrobacter sp. Hiyo1]|nr:hypothetical protein AHiyo1_47110 [Arthrobacter sp. Hiyo1]